MWRGMLLRLLAALQKVERAVETAQRRSQIGAMLAVEVVALIDVMQELQCVADMLPGRLIGPWANRAVAAIEGAAPLGTFPQVHHAAPILGDQRQDPTARHRTAIDPAATVGKQAAHEHVLISHHRGAGATRSAAV